MQDPQLQIIISVLEVEAAPSKWWEVGIVRHHSFGSERTGCRSSGGKRRSSSWQVASQNCCSVVAPSPSKHAAKCSGPALWIVARTSWMGRAGTTMLRS
eukprot:14077359-Alexandrium_andersonii.AAC.2